MLAILDDHSPAARLDISLAAPRCMYQVLHSTNDTSISSTLHSHRGCIVARCRFQSEQNRSLDGGQKSASSADSLAELPEHDPVVDGAFTELYCKRARLSMLSMIL